NIDHFSGHGTDLHSISDANPIFANEKKVAHDRHDDILQSDGNPRRYQPSECSDGSKFGNKREQKYDGDTTPEDDLAYQHELIAFAGVVHIAEDRSSPEFTNQENGSHRDQ